MTFDHTAIPSTDIPAGIDWFRSRFDATVLYADDTWAFLNVGGQKVELVSPHQHPPHVAFKVTEQQLAEAAMQTDKKIAHHRDGTTSIYLHDPFGNVVELVCYPAGETVYEKQ